MKNNFKIKVLILFIAGFLALLFLSTDFRNTPEVQSTSQTQQPANEELQDAPLFTLNDVDGNSVSLSDYHGKVVFVNFWATWCPPCRAEIPDFVKLIDKYGDDGFVILGISVDQPADVHKIPGFVDQYKMNYPVLLDTRGEVVNLYGGVRAVPTTFVLNRDGKALGKIEGMLTFAQVEQILKQLL
jgi:peroxiredoxin